MKLRIVQIIHNVGELQLNCGEPRIEYVIERKNFWGRWKEIFATELEPCRISHKTYADAEAYMMVSYMGHGECRKIGSEYKYIPYVYHAF
jgi:hypothetical protein